ncbi:MAG: serine/threonine-protein kinase [Polyangiales bacterium]
MRVCPRCEIDNDEEARYCQNCGAMLDVSGHGQHDPNLGRIIADRYRLVSVIGEGGMGVVYLADQQMGTATRQVAIKLLHPNFNQDPNVVARFHRECETVIQLHHPNTVQFFDFGELDDGAFYLVMEYIEGRSVQQVLDEEGTLDESRVDHLVRQICGSLHEAHNVGIVHRDLKPDNIMLTEIAGQPDFVKVLDFGIAKQSNRADESSTLTKKGGIVGTPPYMSPEQFSGQPVDKRSDIYSLGVLCYEMLSGRLPFDAKTPWEWATKHLTDPPEPIVIDPTRAPISDAKIRTIMAALSKDPDDRPPDALAFLESFTDATKPHPSIHAANLVRYEVEPVRRSRPLWPWLLAGTALGAAIAAFAFWPHDETVEPSVNRTTVDVELGAAPQTTIASPTLPTVENTDNSNAPSAQPPEEVTVDRPNGPELEPELPAETDASGTDEKATTTPKKPTTSRPTIRRPLPPTAQTNTQPTTPTTTVDRAYAALDRADFDTAIKLYLDAKKASEDLRVFSLKRDIERRSSNAIAIMLASGLCDKAKSLYKKLESAGLQRSAQTHDGSFGCRF